MSIMRCPRCERFVDTDFDVGEDIGNLRRLVLWVCTPCAEQHHAEAEAEQDRASVMEAEAERRESNEPGL